MKDYKLLLSPILIIISFFIGYLFGDSENKKVENTKQYVNIKQSKSKLEINSDENVIIKLNGEEFNSGIIELK